MSAHKAVRWAAAVFAAAGFLASSGCLATLRVPGDGTDRGEARGHEGEHRERDRDRS